MMGLIKSMQADTKTLEKELGSCRQLLAALKLKGDPESKKAHKEYQAKYTAGTQYVADIIDKYAIANALPPNDQKNIDQMYSTLKKTRGDVLNTIDEVKAQKAQVNKALKAAAAIGDGQA